MFCRKCGKPTEGEATVCAQCAAEEQPQPEILEQPQPVTDGEPAVAEILDAAAAPAPVEECAEDAPTQALEEAMEEEPFVLGAMEAEEPKKGKGLRLALLLGGVAAVVAIAVLLIFLLKKEPKEQLAELQLELLEEAADEIGPACDAYIQQAQDKTQTTATRLEFELKAGDALMTVLEQNVGSDLSWLESVGISSERYTQGNKKQILMSLLLNGTELADVEKITVGWQEYVRIAGLTDSYIRMQDQETVDILERLLENGELPMLEGELLADLLRRYGTILINGLEEVTSENKPVTVGGREEDLEVYTVYCRPIHIVSMAKQVGEELHTDVKLEAWLDAVSQYVNRIQEEEAENSGGTYDPEPVDLYRQLLDAFDKEFAAADWEQKKVEALKNPNYVKLVYYVNDDDEIVGLTVTTCTDGVLKEEFSAISVEEDDATAFRFAAEDILITGEAAEAEDMYSGNATLVVDGQELLKITLENAYSNDQASGGKLRLTLGEAVMQEMDLGALSLVSPVLEVDYLARGPEITTQLTLSTMGNTLLTAKLQQTQILAKEITEPAQSIDREAYYSGMDNETLREYTQDLSKKMLEAGVPEQIVVQLFAGLLLALQ